MKKLVYFSIITLSIHLTSYGQVDLGYTNHDLIVQFKSTYQGEYTNLSESLQFDNVLITELNIEFEILSAKPLFNKSNPSCFLIKFKKEIDPISLSKVYFKSGLFEYVEPNYIGEGGGKCEDVDFFPNDTHFDRQWGLVNDGSFGLSPSVPDADVDMELAWDIEQGSSSTLVAVLDSGVKLNHPEFAGRIWQNPNEIGDGIDTDANGYIDDFHGWDFANDDNQASDDHGHGTNVAGIVGANGNNAKGYSGVDLKCSIMICKILDQDNLGQYSWWGAAIYYAVDNGAQVINMSVGGFSESSFLRNAVNYAKENGVIIVVSMMNFDSEIPYYPAAFENTIAVGSTNPNDERTSPFFWDLSSGSSYGQHIDVVAPGNFIYGLSYNSNTNYNSYWGGTSQAAPLVTGLTALLLAQDGTRTFEDIRQILRSTAEDQVGKANEDTPGFDKYHGYGRVNAYNALSQLTSVSESEITDFKVYPNPNTGKLILASSKEISYVIVYNLLGGFILESQVIDNTFADLEALKTGTYIINVFDKNDNIIGINKIVMR